MNFIPEPQYRNDIFVNDFDAFVQLFSTVPDSWLRIITIGLENAISQLLLKITLRN